MDRGPAVEMLWESVDPQEALTTRFGFVNGGDASDWIAEMLDEHWGLSVECSDRLVISDRNALVWLEAGAQRYVAKWSANPGRFEQLQRAARLVDWIAERDVPVARPIAALDGRLLVQTPRPDGRRRSLLRRRGDFLLGLLPVIDGDLLDGSDPRQVDDAGRMLATLHEALADHPVDGHRVPGGDRQVVHNDFRAANLLHDGERIVAVLDFEEITVASRASDIGKASVLLGTHYRDWGPTTEATRSAFVEAYDSQATLPLSETEKQQIDRRATAILKDFNWD